MSITQYSQPKTRLNKHARHVHLNTSSTLRSSPVSISSPSRDKKSVILYYKKISRAKVQKLVHIHACWTRLRQFKRLKSRIRSKKQYQKRMKYRIISQQYLRKLSTQIRNNTDKSSKKINWGQQIEIVEFNKNESPKNISLSNSYKEKYLPSL